MFNTGDLGRMLPDGSLEHFGRVDDQVKIKVSDVLPSPCPGAGRFFFARAASAWGIGGASCVVRTDRC